MLTDCIFHVKFKFIEKKYALLQKEKKYLNFPFFMADKLASTSNSSKFYNTIPETDLLRSKESRERCFLEIVTDLT